MVLEELNYLYQNPPLLMYLRHNPRWYKILYYAPERFNDFLLEAKEKLHLTSKDTLKRWNNNLSFISKMIEYLAKK